MRFAWIALAVVLAAGGSVACGAATDGTGTAAAPTSVAPSPTPSPTQAALTSDEQIELDFFAGSVTHWEGMFRKEQLCVAAMVEGVAEQDQSKIDSAVVYLDAMLRQVDPLVKDYESSPSAGGRVEELEALWSAIADDFAEMMNGLTATLNGKGTKQADAAATAFKADMKMFKSELDALGATY